MSSLPVAIFAEVVYAYGLIFSASVKSWGRTIQHNQDGGGGPRSAHLAWVAVDVIYDGARPGAEADRWLMQRGLKRLAEGDHDHIMPAIWPPD